MAYIQDPRSTNTTNATVDPAFKALRMSMRPVENEGAFRLATRSGLIAAGTGAGILFSFRYTGTGTCMIQSVRVGFIVVTTAFTQGNMSFTLNVVRGYTATDTGGTQITTGNINKVRSPMSQPQIDARIATTALLTSAAATAGVEDFMPTSSIQLDCPATVTNQPMKELLPMSWFSKALTLTNNEGFRLKNTAFAATGTSNLVVQVEWVEYPAISTTFY